MYHVTYSQSCGQPHNRMGSYESLPESLKAWVRATGVLFKQSGGFARLYDDMTGEMLDWQEQPGHRYHLAGEIADRLDLWECSTPQSAADLILKREPLIV